jgi:DNA-binding sugar fermentation-stimulating protein
MLLHQFTNMIEGTVIKRPSKFIKTPYVADIEIKIDDSNFTEEVLGHTPSLGCCGLVDIDATVLLTENILKKSDTKCSHTVQLSQIVNKDKKLITIGVNPKLAEILAENALKKNCLSKLLNIKNYKREATIYIEGKVDSRFDFSGIDADGKPFLMEVKTVPLERDGISYFPDGFRKKVTDTVSPRALKHIQELTLIKKESTNVRCLMCYVIQRSDTNQFMPSPADPAYRKAFYEAIKAGVEIITLQVNWSQNGDATFIRDDLPISCE